MKHAITLLTAAALLLGCGLAQIGDMDTSELRLESATMTAAWIDEGPRGLNQGSMFSIDEWPATTTTIERVENTGDKLLIYQKQTEPCFHAVVGPCGPHVTQWRDAYGVRDGKIVFLGKQEPQPVTTKQTNVTETTTYEYPEN